MYEQLVNKKSKLAVIGLGYVGLPVALAFAKKLKVVAFDINSQRIEMLKKQIDPSGELAAEEFCNTDVVFTDNPDLLKDAQCFIITVPTPVDEHAIPDLSHIFLASETVGKALKKGDYVIFESTVYPGCTEEDCVPVLERVSNLNYIEDFSVGYSPERINPGDKEHTLARNTKVVAGCNEEATEAIARIYKLIVKVGVHKVSSIKVAEAAKVIENTQRDLNIALMNELSIIFDRMGINTYEVLEAAGTKWNFLKFSPGLVGGHCIGVDPYYLTYKAKELGYDAKVILSGRSINDNMGMYVATKLVQQLVKSGKNIAHTRVLIMGATFKENVKDVRNSKVVDIIKELGNFNIAIEVVDPYASPGEFQQAYGLSLTQGPGKDYDAVVVAVCHKPYLELDEEYFKSIMKDNAILVDIKGLYRNRISHIKYITL
ncbi:nucleotide sugar dehydrogenase [Pontibacter silvestris]|uniref:Nucleotide sugar dehydrogenase n=1 Tax=Pontibacter silvestris TaxID=2305183 RepID=A0ABW4WVC5_9BACT|nr:nucleotide sugar dehydrogenase [Pontibacter silvestris]MCC9136609.1 nucleotide sugar dehydrogenase [Pontibacter silvestris]